MGWVPREWPRGIRMRTTVSAALVVAVALLVASAALVLLQGRQLTNGLAAVAQQQSALLADQITEGGVEAVDVTALSATAGEPAVVQVLGVEGQVLLASDDEYATEAITDRRPPPGQTEQDAVASVPGEDDEPFVVVAAGVEAADGPVVVVTAQSLESVERSTGVLLTLLAVGVPLVLLVVTVTSYRLVGRALAPVEGIRARVAQVSVADQDARVPVPDSGDEIARLAETMNSMLGRLQASAAAQHAFVADASHELRSPLATIKATTELSRSHPEAMDPDSVAATILTETARLERLVADLLLLARADENGLVMRVGDVDLDDIVVAEKARLSQAGVEEVELQVRAVRVTGDAQHLVRAVRNLTDNAARHALSRVEIRLDVVDGHAQLDVIDDGPGVPDADRERIFDRFVRLDSSRQRGTGGTGLGLAITRQIARAHGGDAQFVRKGEGRGACVRLSLPLTEDSEQR
ncbi:MAG: HAMP domain-containing sensor histidine kinase [Ornithinimicrobium sp.]